MSKFDIVDDFYNQACKQYSTYETMVIKGFCSSMDERFDPVRDKDAFDYAREEYNYLTPSEIHTMDSEDEGVCRHGLTVNTCPCGCFED